MKTLMSDLILMVVLFLIFWEILIGTPSKHKVEGATVSEFNGADTLKIMIHNDSITEIKPYRK